MFGRARRQRAPALDPAALNLGLLRLGGQRPDRFLDAAGELTRAFLRLRDHRLANAHARRTWQRYFLAPRHDLVGAANVHRDHGGPGFVGEVTDARLELLDAAVGGSAALRKENQVPSRLEQPAGGVELILGAPGAVERKRVREQATRVA